MSPLGVAFGVVFIGVGIVGLIWSRGLASLMGRQTERLLPSFMARLVKEAPLGLDVRRRTLVVGAGLVVIGAGTILIEPVVG